VRGAGEEEHEGEAGDAREQVAQGEGEEKGGKQGVHLRTSEAWIEEVALLPEGGGGDAEAGGLGPGLQDRGGLLPGTFGGVEGEQVEEVGDAGHQGEEGGKEGDEETSKDGRRPDWEKAPLGGCSGVVVPAATDENKPGPAGGDCQ